MGVFERLPRGNPRPTARSRPTPAQGALGDGHSGRAFDFGPCYTLTGILPRTQALHQHSNTSCGQRGFGPMGDMGMMGGAFIPGLHNARSTRCRLAMYFNGR